MSGRMLTTLVALTFVYTIGTPALADGILLPIRPDGPTHVPFVLQEQLFTIKYHHVDVTIDDQLCTTKVDQVFHNNTGSEAEGMYMFPMPEGSAITKFSMYAGEDEIVGKVMDKDEARGIYESIVRQRKDPALLEYIGRNTFRARVYPIPANGDKKIRLNYAEVAAKNGTTCRYVYPLSTERFSAKPLEDCRVTIRIKSKRPIINVYSPSHAIKVDRPDDHRATVTWSAKDVKPDTDLLLYYSVSNDDVGIDLLTYREPGKKGYFMLLASPRAQIDKAGVQPKNVVFVLDRTGSMGGEKIEQAKEALKFCIRGLRNQDRFNVITFNETPETIFQGLRQPTAEIRRKALDKIDEIDATGGTNINEALIKARTLIALDSSTRSSYIVFLTDGQPTVGERDPEVILKNAKSDRARIFVFGVGYDVNAHLLDKLARQNRGTSDYVRPRENIEVKVSEFFAKVSEPLLSDVRLSIHGLRKYDGSVFGVKTSDTLPSGDLPDIFVGSQLIALGRYDGSGKVTVSLSGSSAGKQKTFETRVFMPESGETNQFIPQLWASRKIGYLLDEIRLRSNQELIDEVVRLSKEYGIPTEFTSFLADERRELSAEVQRAKVLAFSASSVQTGSHAVSQSANNYALKDSVQVAAAAPAGSALDNAIVIGKVAANGRIGGYYQDANDQTVVVANVQNVAQRAFYQRGEFWEDGNLTPNQQAVRIKQFSNAHFKLIKAYPKLSQYSTLGNVRLLLENNQAIEIGPEGKEEMTDEEVGGLLNGVAKEVRGLRSSPGPTSAWTDIATGLVGTCIVIGLASGRLFARSTDGV